MIDILFGLLLIGVFLYTIPFVIYYTCEFTGIYLEWLLDKICEIKEKRTKKKGEEK